MQMYKLVEAKRIHKGFQRSHEFEHEFEKVIEFLKKTASLTVRASYNIYL
uniref:Uncharacterized protein n=1 Tax=Ficus carica TaxID=3494 RepID=A0AA87ZDC9_FICCA|nr:hypothetical protein TIFTF001_048016 [Ficus carica]